MYKLFVWLWIFGIIFLYIKKKYWKSFFFPDLVPPPFCVFFFPSLSRPFASSSFWIVVNLPCTDHRTNQPSPAPLLVVRSSSGRGFSSSPVDWDSSSGDGQGAAARQLNLSSSEGHKFRHIQVELQASSWTL